VNGVRLPPPDDNNNDDSDADSDAGGAQRGDEAVAAPADEGDASSSRQSPLARSRLHRGSGISATSDSEGDSDGLLPTSDASHPPQSSPERDEAAAELDALLEDEEALRAASSSAVPTAHAWKAPSDVVAMDEDKDLWDLLDTGAPTSGAASQTAAVSAPPTMDDDEDMWDIVNEIEQDKAKEAAPQPNPVQELPVVASAQADDYDDLYL
jgi:hypothetical protein